LARKTAQKAPKDIALLEKGLGYSFRNARFLELALTHPSFTVEEFTDNERLEFLGDSVLSLAISEHLYRTLPRCAEGELTRIKSSVVSTAALARASRRIDLAEFMRIGKGLGNRGRLPDSVHANVTEAVFAAVYLDGGYLAALDVIVRLLAPEVDIVAASAGSENAKSQLQELAQRELGCSPRYRLISESGPQHGKTFVIAVELGDRAFPEYSGNTKKEAEQGAARQAIEELRARKRREQEPERPEGRSSAARKSTRRAGRRVKARKEAAKTAVKTPAKPPAEKAAPATSGRASKPAKSAKAARPKGAAKGSRTSKRSRTGTRRGKRAKGRNPYDMLGGE
jgi:ribonuclease-3